jgi:catalase
MIPVNAPKAATMSSYQRDGAMNSQKDAAPNYYPNTFGGAMPSADFIPPAIDVSGMAKRHTYVLSDIDFVQAGELYRRAMSESDRKNLIKNISSHLKNAKVRIQLRQTALFYKADTDYGTQVAKSLGIDVKKVKKLAAMSQADRVKATS